MAARQVLALKMAEAPGDVSETLVARDVSARLERAGPSRDRDSEGRRRVRQVIMALSPSQAAAITFSPALPKPKAALIAAWPTAGSGVKIHASYPRPFWRDLGLSGNIYDLDGPFAWATDASPPDASVGVLTALGRSGDAMTTAARRAATLAVFAECFGPQAPESDRLRGNGLVEGKVHARLRLAARQGGAEPARRGDPPEHGTADLGRDGNLDRLDGLHGRRGAIRPPGRRAGARRAGEKRWLRTVRRKERSSMLAAD